MAPIVVRIHLQDDSDNCGQACAQMVLQVVASRLFQQSVITSYLPADWTPGTTPDQLADMINQKTSAKYKVTVKRGQAAALNALEASVNAGAPSIALVNDGAHWVVIRGITRTSALSGVVHIRNPMPPIDVVSTPFAHTGSDNCPNLDFSSQTGESDDVVSLNEWAQTFFTACDLATPSKFRDRFVVVVR